MLSFFGADISAVVDTATEVIEGLVETFAKLLVLLNVDAADTENSKEVVKRFPSGEPLDKSAERMHSFDEMLLFSRVFDKGLKRSIGVDVTSGIERLVDPFVQDVEDSGYGVVILFIVLSAITDLLGEV